MANVLNASYFNLGNWTKNMNSFPIFNNSYTNGANTLSYKGGAEYERIYIPVEVEPFWEYTFRFSFHSPSGFTMGDYGYHEAFAFVCADIPSDMNAALTRGILGRSEGWDTAASSTSKQYAVHFNSGNRSIVYLAFDFGYIIDGVTSSYVFSNISLDDGTESGDLEKHYDISWETMRKIANGTRLITGTTEELTTEDIIYLLGCGGYAPIFNSTASGHIPDYDHVYGVSTLDISGLNFTSSAVGMLS